MSVASISNFESGSSLASNISAASQLLSKASSVQLKRTYLVIASKMKFARHGQVAEDISKCDLQADQLDREGSRLEAFVYKERALVMRQKLYGVSHPVVTECAKELALQYSIVAMDLVRAGDKEASLQLVQKSEVVAASSLLFPDPIRRRQLVAVLSNNFGVYYKFLGKYSTALKYLQRALKIETTTPGCQNPAGTHLNVCALLSQMGRHRSALHHAQLATNLLEQERSALAARVAAKTAAAADMQTGEASTPREGIHAHDAAFDSAVSGDDSEGEPALKSSASGRLLGSHHTTGSGTPPTATTETGSDSENRVCLLVISLYNGAVEMEHIGAYASAVETYEYALQLARDELGPDHSLAESVATTLRYAKRAARKAARLTSMNAQTSKEDLGLNWMESGSSGDSLKGKPSPPAERRPKPARAPAEPATDAAWSATGGYTRTKSSSTVRSSYGQHAMSRGSLAPQRDATWSASSTGPGRTPVVASRELTSSSSRARRVVEVVGSKW